MDDQKIEVKTAMTSALEYQTSAETEERPGRSTRILVKINDGVKSCFLLQ